MASDLVCFVIDNKSSRLIQTSAEMKSEQVEMNVLLPNSIINTIKLMLNHERLAFLEWLCFGANRYWVKGYD